MTDFHDRDPQPGDAWVTPGDDDLDRFLNTDLTSDGPPDVDAHDLASTARAFHRRLNEAQTTDSRSAQPDPALWDRILADSSAQPKDNVMSSVSFSPHAVPSSLDSGARRSAQHVTPPRHSRLGRWANALAAVSLVLLVGVGVWFSGYGPGGPSGNDNPRYAAQVVSPIASPDASGVGCTLEPLNESEAIKMARDPSGWIMQMSQGTVTEMPYQLSGEHIMLFAQPGLGDVATLEEYSELQDVVDQYLACWTAGSLAQMWSVYDPHMLQFDIAPGKPSNWENEVEFRVHQRIDNPGIWAFPGVGYQPEQFHFRATEDRDNVRIQDVDGVRIAYVGTDTFDLDGHLVQSSNWYDQRAQDISKETPSVGAVTLVQYPGIDRWFVCDQFVQGLVWPSGKPAASPFPGS